MKIYNYDPITFEYLGEENAYRKPGTDESEGKNAYILPAYATFVKPPAKQEDNARIFENGEWVYTLDYRKNYYAVDDTLTVFNILQLGELPEGYYLVSKKLGDEIRENPNDYIIVDSEVRKKTKKEKKVEEKAEFDKQYFNTSLGYVERRLTRQDGTIKDFLTDILPLLEVGTTIITYTKELEAQKVQVTEEFLNECKKQVLADFYGGIE